MPVLDLPSNRTTATISLVLDLYLLEPGPCGLPGALVPPLVESESKDERDIVKVEAALEIFENLLFAIWVPALPLQHHGEVRKKVLSLLRFLGPLSLCLTFLGLRMGFNPLFLLVLLL